MLEKLLPNGTERGASPVIGIVLMAAIAVLLAASIGVFVLDIVNENTQRQSAAQGTYDFEYNYKNSSIDVTYEAGNSIAVEKVGFPSEDDVITKQTVGETFDPGETVTILNPDIGRKYNLVRETDGGTTVIASYSPQNNFKSIFLFNPSAENTSDMDKFNATFKNVSNPDNDGVMWRDQGEYVEFAEEGPPGQALYYADLSENTKETVRVRLDFRAESFDSSGVRIYAEDADGDIINIACDGGGGIDCGNRGQRFTFRRTYTVSSDSPIKRIYIDAHPENVYGNWWDRGQIYRIEVLVSQEK